MEIYLVRHGETNWNKEFRFQGQTDIPLNEYGIELAQDAAAKLKEVPFDIAFCSPLCRAVETAKIILGNRQIPLTPDKRLLEISFGCKEGCNFLEAEKDPSDPIYNFLKNPANYEAPEGAESFQELYNRSGEFMEQIILPLENQYRNVLIVAHGALNRSILNPIADIPLKDFWQIKLPNCAISRIRLENGVFSLL